MRGETFRHLTTRTAGRLVASQLARGAQLAVGLIDAPIGVQIGPDARMAAAAQRRRRVSVSDTSSRCR